MCTFFFMHVNKPRQHYLMATLVIVDLFVYWQLKYCISFNSPCCYLSVEDTCRTQLILETTISSGQRDIILWLDPEIQKWKTFHNWVKFWRLPGAYYSQGLGTQEHISNIGSLVGYNLECPRRSVTGCAH